MSTPIVDVLRTDTQSLQKLLEAGKVNSVDLVEIYLAQIKKHDGYLHSMITLAEEPTLREAAERLDAERKASKVRSPLHGVPIIIKDNINTVDMKTTAGSLALDGCRPRENAKIVDKLSQAGMIIMGKANLTNGWSGLGGLTQSAYVRGGFVSTDESSSTIGSSSGSAVSVSAGYAPISIGTETCGSLTCPASRAALYTIKPSIGLVSQHGIVPISHNCDTAGPMGKTAFDIAALLDVLTDTYAPGRPDGGYTSSLDCSWADIKVAAVKIEGPELPDSEDKIEEVDKKAMAQMVIEYRAAYEKVKNKAAGFYENVPLSFHKLDPSFEETDDALFTILMADFQKDFPAYLDSLEYTPVKSFEEIIEFNKTHADVEMPPDARLTIPASTDFLVENDNQALFEEAVSRTISEEEYQKCLELCRKESKQNGIDRILDTYGADIVIAPANGGWELWNPSSMSGYPVAAMPLGYLETNGAPFGMCAMARQHEEAKLIKFMKLWEDTIEPRKVPEMLDGKSEIWNGEKR
ncbi:amidase family protein [Rutstroemia sp. NJR-2017a WRK4]|nr:amidase family protein [Rutstroemia sp. NJR-2017a WRK4]